MCKTKYAALFLTLALAFQLNIPAFAAGSTTATVPVTLTVTNEYRSVDVTVPASLPVQVVNGTVITADNARITNNAKSGSIRVTAVSVKDGAYKVGDYERFSGSKTIALEINGSPPSYLPGLRVSRNRGRKQSEADLQREGFQRRSQRRERASRLGDLHHLACVRRTV